MIIIEDSDFKMEQVKSTPFFDLSLMVPINEGKPNERYELKLIGHGMTFEACLQRIVSYKLGDYDDIYSVKEYVELYEKEVDSIMGLLRNVQNSKNSDKEEID